MNHSLALVSPIRSNHFPMQTQLVQRLVLYRSELYRVPACYHLLRVRAGKAYVTQAGRDHMLVSGQEMHLDNAMDIALVSGMGDEPMILELFDITGLVS